MPLMLTQAAVATQNKCRNGEQNPVWGQTRFPQEHEAVFRLLPLEVSSSKPQSHGPVPEFAPQDPPAAAQESEGRASGCLVELPAFLSNGLAPEQRPPAQGSNREALPHLLRRSGQDAGRSVPAHTGSAWGAALGPLPVLTINFPSDTVGPEHSEDMGFSWTGPPRALGRQR